MALKLVPTSQFKKDYKRAKKRGLDMSELQSVLDKLCADELEKMFDIDAERIAEIDEAASKGVLPGTPGNTVTGPGRPPLFDEAMQQVSFKEPSGRVRAIDRRAQELGIRRSDYLRQLVENDLRCAGMI